jgi:hypothetical protein
MMPSDRNAVTGLSSVKEFALFTKKYEMDDYYFNLAFSNISRSATFRTSIEEPSTSGIFIYPAEKFPIEVIFNDFNRI